MKNIEPLRRDKGYLIHVGSLCPSVSEVYLDLVSNSFSSLLIACSLIISLPTFHRPISVLLGQFKGLFSEISSL